MTVEFLRSEGSATLLFSGAVAIAGGATLGLDSTPAIFLRVPPGTQTVTVVVNPSDCTVVGESTQEVEVVTGTTIVVQFEVTCSFEPMERIAYQTGAGSGDIRTIRPDGSDPMILTFEEDVTGFPAWSPDGSRIAYSCQIFTLGQPFGGQGICSMNWDGTEQRALLGPGPSLFDGSSPAWSPDGAQLTFQARSAFKSADDKDIWGMSSDGDGANAFFEEEPEFYVLNADTEDAQAPAWSSDDRIAFSNGGFVTVMNSDGSGLTTLAEGFAPKWSPDSARLTYVSPELDVWIMNADGTNQTQVTDLGATAGVPSFSPDGQSILFHSPADGLLKRIWIVAVAGTNPRPLEVIPPDPASANVAWFAPSGP